MSNYINNKIINSFIESELGNEDMKNDLIEILNNLNIILCEYECNQHIVIFDRTKDSITVIDYISKEHGVKNTDVLLSYDDFKNIIMR